MPRQVEFLFDFGSPTSYIAYRRLATIADRTGATIVWTPVLLGAILQSLGNTQPTAVPAKRKWFFADLALWARQFGIEYQENPHFPVVTLALQRGAIALQGSPLFAAYVEAVFSAMWQTPRNLGDATVLEQVLTSAGIDTEDFKARIGSPEVKNRLKANTDSAISRGVFGCPSFFVGDQLFFGQDRLHFVEEALLAQPGELP